jgi:phosphoribosyl-ATP pyrophosphohydrolase
MSTAMEHLYDTIVAHRVREAEGSRTAKLFRDGMTKMAKKMAEEAVEVALDAVQGNREAVIRESADLLYNLSVLWVQADIRPQDIWAELRRREEMMGIAEKLPKSAAAVDNPA